MAKDEKLYVIRNRGDAIALLNIVAGLDTDGDQPWIVRISKAKEARRSKQNRLSWLWYTELGKMTGHGKDYEHQRCKLNHGIPILREDADFNQWWEDTLGHLIYEQQLLAMQHMDVTSLMSVREFARYLTAIDEEAASMMMILTHPDDLYMDALYRQAITQADLERA